MTTNSLTEFSPKVYQKSNSIPVVIPPVIGAEALAALRAEINSPLPARRVSRHSVRLLSQGENKSKSDPKLPTSKDLQTRKRYDMLRTLKKLLPGEQAIQDSMTKAVRGVRQATIQFNPEKRSTYVRGVATSKSYSDPVCAHRRAAQDRRELSVLIAQAEKRGCGALLATSTMSHSAGMPLKLERETLQTAWSATFSGRWWGNLKAKYQVEHEGVVKVWEAPIGFNGWHAHPHGLFIMSRPLSEAELEGFEAEIKHEYIRQLQILGYKADYEHGIDVRSGSSEIASYIAKFGREPQNPTWGVDAEIASIAVKKSRFEGLSYWELLGAATGYQEDLDRLEILFPQMDKCGLIQRAGQLVKEFFYAFKTVHRLQWSAGLWDKFDMDTALAELEAATPDPEQQTFPMAVIEHSPTGWWRLVQRHLIADLLNLCRRGDAFAVAVWLREKGIDGCVPQVAFAYSLELDETKETEQHGL